MLHAEFCSGEDWSAKWQLQPWLDSLACNWDRDKAYIAGKAEFPTARVRALSSTILLCRPSVVLSAVPGGGYQQQYVAAGGGRLKWRLSQFKSPETSYRLRARADAEALPPDNIPQVNFASHSIDKCFTTETYVVLCWQIAGRIIERPSSAASHQRATQRPPPKMTKSHSSCSLLHNTSSGPLSSMQQHMPQQTTVGGIGKVTRTSSGTPLPV